MRARLASYLAWIGLVALLCVVGSSVSVPARAADLGALTATPSPTPTIPAPVLLEPADNAMLPQPVSPEAWTFRWFAVRGACKCSIAIWQPVAGIYLGEQNIGAPREYAYYYTSASPIPSDALEGWQWKVWVTCPNGSNESETRTFSIRPGSTPGIPTRALFPVMWNQAQ